MKLKQILTRHINYILCCKSFKIMIQISFIFFALAVGFLAGVITSFIVRNK